MDIAIRSESNTVANDYKKNRGNTMNTWRNKISLSLITISALGLLLFAPRSRAADLVVYSTSSCYANSNAPQIQSIYAYVDQYCSCTISGIDHTSAYWPYWGNNWYQSSFTVEYGYSMTLTNVYFENRSGTSGPTNYNVAYQANGSPITSISGGIQSMPRDGLYHTNIANNGGTPVSGLTGTVFILIYGGNAVSYSTISCTGIYEWRHRNIRIQGTITQLPIPPARATTPSPTTNATVHKNSPLSWQNGGGANGYRVYLSTSNNISPSDLKAITNGTACVSTSLNYNTTYYWRIDPTNAYGVTTGAVWSFTTGSPFPDAVNAPELEWSSGGASLWFGQTNVSHDTNSAGQSGPMGYSSTSWVSTVVSGPGNMKFWWRVSSYSPYHVLRYYVDTQQVASITGSTAWQFYSNNIASGVHTVMWAYTKNNYGPPAGLDAGWVDQVIWTIPGSSFLLTAAAGPNGNVTPTSTNVPAGQNASFLVTPSNYFHVEQIWTNGGLFGSNFGSTAYTYVWSNVTATGELYTTFSENLGTNYSTPYTWLARYGFTNNMSSAEMLVGSNRIPVWQSYVADLNPTNPNSQFVISAFTSGAGSAVTLMFTTATGRLYSVFRDSTIVGAAWTNVLTNDMPGTGGSTTLSDAATSTSRFYQLKVRLP